MRRGKATQGGLLRELPRDYPGDYSRGYPQRLEDGRLLETAEGLEVKDEINCNTTRFLSVRSSETRVPILGKQVWIILQRTLNTVRKEPTQIVTALRIVEREEMTDQSALQRQKGSGFLPPRRPKKWREKAFAVLESSAAQRIEGGQFEDRETSKNWLIKHLEVIRLLLLEDMKVIKSLVVCHCFP
ncbi:exocyst complex component 3-like, partial [Penaeus monodon]|uniref:exocyst complex component 3-like n=1 Tax=Penaeus monodon TaxID=6687 RepID=UPI0018A7CCC8